MPSFLDMIDGFKAKRQQPSSPSSSPKPATSRRMSENELSRENTWGSVSSTSSTNSVQKSKSNGSQVQRKATAVARPTYPANWETSSRNSRRKRTPPTGSRRSSSNGSSSATAAAAAAPTPSMDPPPYSIHERPAYEDRGFSYSGKLINIEEE